MPSQPTIPDIIELAKICQYLASNGVDMDSFFSNGSLDPLLPVKIYDVRKGLEWGYNQNYIAASATGTFLISGTFEVGGVITVEVIDPILGLITIGTYTIVSGDTTLTLLAQHVAAAITGSGYTATNDGEMVIVTAPISLGNTINGVNLIVNYTAPIGSFLLINSTDNLLINSTDKLLIA